MKIFLLSATLTLLSTWITDAECVHVNQGIQKRVPERTNLWHWTHVKKTPKTKVLGPDYLPPVVEAQGKGQADSITWGSDTRSLALLTHGDFAVAVESNVGAWMCVLDGAGISRAAKSVAYELFWLVHCEGSLLLTLAEWEDTLKQAGQGALRILGAQVFALGTHNKRVLENGELTNTNLPMGGPYRPRLVEILKGLLRKSRSDFPRSMEAHQVSLLGWPMNKRTLKKKTKPPNKSPLDPLYGFAIVQEDFQQGDAGATSTVNIYSSGYGRSQTKGNIPYGTSPALWIQMTGGVRVRKKGETDEADWVFRDSVSSDIPDNFSPIDIPDDIPDEMREYLRKIVDDIPASASEYVENCGIEATPIPGKLYNAGLFDPLRPGSRE